ncbi:MAG TPA: helix-turn-helix domain-containing protein [Paracoccaceae bacterium]|nr:helix-turn-helix domain-containing protein [Paracoccaceae bacterium]
MIVHSMDFRMPRRIEEQLNFVDQLEKPLAAEPTLNSLRTDKVARPTEPRRSKASALTGVQVADLPHDIVSEPECRFFSDKDVAKRYGVSRPTIWRWVKNNAAFPKPKQLSPGTTRWKLSDLQTYERTLGTAHCGNTAPGGGA